MEYQIDLIKDPLVKNNINFSEKYYFSSDKKSILGEVPFKEILFIEYRETEAGSNPREYTGLKKANLNIIKSLLKDYNNMFRFLHSGVNISLVNGVPDNSYKNITYDFCCLTNGNQTRFIILILVLLKILYGNNDLKTVTTKEYNKFIKEYFKDYPKALNVIPFIKPSKFNQVINFLNNNTKYLNNFKIMDFEEFLKSRIRVQINLIDSILQDLDEDLDEYSTGTLIAEANNDTQNVKVDDIFGNRYRRDLEEKIFKEFITTVQLRFKKTL